MSSSRWPSARSCSAELDTPRELVWKVSTDPDEVTRWWGPEHFTTPREKMEFDLRPGSICRMTMVGPDGEEYPSDGHSGSSSRPSGCRSAEERTQHPMIDRQDDRRAHRSRRGSHEGRRDISHNLRGGASRSGPGRLGQSARQARGAAGRAERWTERAAGGAVPPAAAGVSAETRKAEIGKASLDSTAMSGDLNNHHRDTLKEDPRSSGERQRRAAPGAPWPPQAVGTVDEEQDGKFKVTLCAETETLSMPRGKDIDRQMVVDLRRTLPCAGLSAESAERCRRLLLCSNSDRPPFAALSLFDDVTARPRPTPDARPQSERHRAAGVTCNLACPPAPAGVRKIESRIAEPPEPGASGWRTARDGHAMRARGEAHAQRRRRVGVEATPLSWPEIEARRRPSTPTSTSGMNSPCSHSSHVPVSGTRTWRRGGRAVSSAARSETPPSSDAGARDVDPDDLGRARADEARPGASASCAKPAMVEHWIGSPPRPASFAPEGGRHARAPPVRPAGGPDFVVGALIEQAVGGRRPRRGRVAAGDDQRIGAQRRGGDQVEVRRLALGLRDRGRGDMKPGPPTSRSRSA